MTFQDWLTAQHKAAARISGEKAKNTELQRLERREAAYAEVLKWPEQAGKISVSGVADRTFISRATLYRDFQASNSWRAGTARDNLLAEATEAGFAPYADGLRAGLVRVQPGRDKSVEAVLVVAATWAVQHPSLARSRPMGPELACRLVTEMDPRLSFAAAVEHVGAVIAPCLTDPSLTPIGALGVARQRLYPAPKRQLDPQQRATVEEGLLWYANQMIDRAERGDPVEAELDMRPVLEQVTALLGRLP